MATIAEILRMSVEERKTAYKATGIDKVIIDGNEFTDYGAFSFLWEKSYVKSPERSGDGTISNLNSYATFLTPHLKIDFSMMSIDSYRRLMELLYSKNEFVVSCYDIVKNIITTNKMYFATEEMPKLWTIARALNGEEWVELLGVQDYTVEMIGTNASFDTVDILYYDNNGNLLNSQQANSGTETIVNFTFTPSAGKKFEGEWITANGTSYRNGSAIFVQSDNINKSELKLVAKVIDSNEYTLSFNYGNGNSLITQTNGDLVNIPIRNGETLSTAIQKANIRLDNGNVFTFPANGTGINSVVYEGKTYNGNEVYSFVGWFWTSTPSEQTRVTGATVYNYNLNRTIYQIYQPIERSISFRTHTDNIAINDMLVKYGENVVLPVLALQGQTFKYWYYIDLIDNKSEEIVFNNNSKMPPFNLVLHAKWE